MTGQSGLLTKPGLAVARPRCKHDDEPPGIGWAIGTGGLFRDGVRIAYEAEVQLSGPGSVAVRPLEAEPKE